MTTVKFKKLPDGSFVCGDTETGLTAYAYATSYWATLARRKPRSTAALMLAEEQPFTRLLAGIKAYDERNWERLNEKEGERK